MTRRIRTIDAHVEGAPVRLVVDGWPRLEGTTMRRRLASARRAADPLRRALCSEPRGHRDLVGALLTEPASPSASAGMLFMSGARWLACYEPAAMAAAAIALDRALLTGVPEGEALTFDTLAGPLSVGVAPARGGNPARAARAWCHARPACVLAAGAALELDGRRVLGDVAWSGGIRLVVDSEATRVPLRAERLEDLRRAALALLARFDARAHLPGAGVPARRASGVAITGPAQGAGAAVRIVSVSSEGAVDRSPSVCGSAAVLAVLDGMGLFAGEAPSLDCEGIEGTRFEVALEGRGEAFGRPAVLARVTGGVWITGEHTFLLSGDDPLVR
jgi:proline racemase